MIVAAHGNVDAYCEAHGMTIGERYSGDVGEYRGSCLVLVTDNCEDLNDYYYLKYRLMRRNVELVSTHWKDSSVEDFVQYLNQREKQKRKEVYTGRVNFGFRRVDGETVEVPQDIRVARRIIELRDAGYSYRKITEDPEVCYSDGRKMPVSTIQVILRNRSKYE
jgi:hypothetical protein